MDTNDEVEIDLSEADPDAQEPEIDWDDIDFEEEPETIAPLPEFKTSWGEIDAAALFRGDLDEPPPTLLARGDERCLLYRGKVNGIMGEPETGKGWFAHAAIVEAMIDGYHVVYIDFEDTPQGVFNRLRLMGVPDGLVQEKFHYVRPAEPLTYAKGVYGPSMADLITVIHRAYSAQGGLALIVFDGITECLAMQGVESKDNDLVADWFGNVPRRFAHASKAAVLLIDHVVKAEDARGRYAIGAQAKLSAIDGCQYVIRVKKAFARNRSGLARISVVKDRPGHVREIAAGYGTEQPVADMDIIATGEDGHLSIKMLVPDIETNEEGKVKPTAIQGEIIKYLKRVKGGRGRQDILDMIAARSQTKRMAFNDMLDNGWLEQYREGRKTLFRIGTPQTELEVKP